MKNKDNRGISRILRMLYLCIFALIIAGTVSTAAFAEGVGTESNFYVENCNLTEEYSLMLSEEGNKYSLLDTDAQKTVSKNVLSVINLYRKELLDLQSHSEASDRSLLKEVKLSYAKGCSAGRGAWIYFYNISLLDSPEAAARVKTVYDAMLKSVADATDSAVLLAEADIMCAQLNVAVYKERIGALAKEGDSLACASILAGGLERIEMLDSPDLFGTEHLAVYEETVNALELQRARDVLCRDLESIYKTVFAGADHTTDPSVALFTYKLKNAESVQEMNSALQSTLSKLLEVSEDKHYAYLHSSRLIEKISQAVLKANKDNVAADVTSLFLDYTIEKLRADAKDEVYTIVFAGSGASDAELSRIESYFNSEGGKLDGASSKGEIECEVIRARYEKLCYNTLLKINNDIAIILEPYDKSVFYERANLAYKTAISALEKLELSLKFEDNCKSIFDKCKTQLDEILTESKAERFLLDHKDIISKPPSELTTEDELRLREALTDYVKLDPATAATLISQINSIAEKYNSVLSQKIRSYAAKDALYLDLCEISCKEIKNLPRTNIDVYYNNCDLILKKAEKLCKVISDYRALCASKLYASYNASEREALVKICRECADLLGAVDVSDKATFSEEISRIGENATVQMHRTNEIVRIRICVRDSENAQILAISAEASARINACFDKSEMISIADKAIFRINRLQTADHVDIRAEKEKLNIASMNFLTDAEKSEWKAKISALTSSTRDDALLAENVTVLQFLWNNFCEELAKISSASAEIDLVRSRDAHQKLFGDKLIDFASSIQAMVHLSAEESADFLNRSANLEASFSSSLSSAQSSAEVEALFATSLESLNSLKLSADSKNVSNYKDILSQKIEQFKTTSQNYSAQNYNKILSLIEQFNSQLSSAQTLDACLAVYESTNSKILSVNDLLDDAKALAVKNLDDKLASLTANSTLYSSEALASLDSLLREAKSKINSYTILTDIPAVAALADEYIQKLSLVKCDYATSAPNGLGFVAEGAQYPLQYDFNDGYWGLIYLPNSLSSDLSLSITPVASNLRDIEKQIRRAMRDGEALFFGAEPNDNTLKLLKKGKVALGANITLGDISTLGKPFTLQMLLPDTLSDERVLGVAFVRDDGKIEFYSAEQRGLLISTELHHLSNYYVIIENTIDLTPLIILLAIIIGIELLMLAFIMLIRYRRKRGKGKEKDPMFPLISACFVNPLALASIGRVRPSGAVTTVIFMSVAALALGCGIAILAKAELHERKNGSAAKTDESVRSAREERLLAQRKKSLLGAKKLELAAARAHEELLPQEPLSACATALKEKEELSFDESDVEEIEEPNSTATDTSATYSSSARHRAEINLDVIAEKFSSGELVTLDALKRKRLVPKKTDHIKILARGALSKPLIIEAHDFSRAAEEMLFAVGGEAIKIKK